MALLVFGTSAQTSVKGAEVQESVRIEAFRESTGFKVNAARRTSMKVVEGFGPPPTPTRKLTSTDCTSPFSCVSLVRATMSMFVTPGALRNNRTPESPMLAMPSLEVAGSNAMTCAAGTCAMASKQG